MRSTWIALPALAGCWVHADDYWDGATYQEEYAATYCDLVFGCNGVQSGWASKEECREVLAQGPQDTTGCTYDPAAARECVEEWAKLSCAALNDGVAPPVCAQIYDCQDSG